MSAKDQFAPGADAYREKEGDSFQDSLTAGELAYLANTTEPTIMQMVDCDLLAPRVESGEMSFRVDDVQIVRKILRLQRHLQLSLDSMALVFDLMDRIAALEARIGELEKE